MTIFGERTFNELTKIKKKEVMWVGSVWLLSLDKRMSLGEGWGEGDKNMQRNEEKTTMEKPRKETLGRKQLYRPLELRLLTSRTAGKELFKSPSLHCFVMAALTNEFSGLANIKDRGTKKRYYFLIHLVQVRPTNFMCLLSISVTCLEMTYFPCLLCVIIASDI